VLLNIDLDRDVFDRGFSWNCSDLRWLVLTGGHPGRSKLMLKKLKEVFKCDDP
jgi:hypothetical protein